MRFTTGVVTFAIVALSNLHGVRAEPAAPSSSPDVTTEQATSAPQSDRVPHPVVYLDSMKTNATPKRVPHPVVYDTEPGVEEPRSRVPHPVVYPDEQAPTAKPEVARTPSPAAETPDAIPRNADTETAPSDSEPAVLPPNPDLDTSDQEIAKPTDPDGDADVSIAATKSPAAPSAAAEPLQTLITEKRSVELDEAEWAAVAKVYEALKFEPVWVAETGVAPAGQKLISALEAADQWGLDPAQFDIPDVASAGSGAGALLPETWADLELQITAAALRYANHARGGRILNPTEQLSSYIDRKPQLKDPTVVLNKLVVAPDPSSVLHGLHPRHPQFEQLRQKYLALKAAADKPGVVRIPSGALLREGVTHPHVALLRKRLEIADVAPEHGTPFDPELFDETVLEAVKAYQREAGISVDGLVGNGTRRALNDIAVPDPAKILANMEQWRWMPDDLGDIYIWANIPEFKVRVVKNGEVIHTERIITGKTNQQTPVFSDVVETLYFHPKWHVPQSIKVNELYPSLARGGASFRRQNLRIAYNGRPINPYNMDWSNRDIRRYHVYQPPGPGNVLGVVKFTFPNKHQVYMHDTPTKHLFKNKQRTYSHGCVRVRNPVSLAKIIVREANGMTEDEVMQIIRGQLRETPVKLDKKIPVHLTYLTAWVDEDGNEQAAKDIYGHEKKIKLALDGRFDQIAVGPDHLAPVKFKPRPQQFYGTTAVEDFFKNLFPGF